MAVLCAMNYDVEYGPLLLSLALPTREAASAQNPGPNQWIKEATSHAHAEDRTIEPVNWPAIRAKKDQMKVGKLNAKHGSIASPCAANGG